MAQKLGKKKGFLGAMPWPLWLLALGAAAWFGRKWLLIGASILAFYPIPIPPLFLSEPASVEESRLQDLRHFNHVRRNERSMDAEMRARFDAQVESLRQRAGELSDAEFMLGLARAQATIDNGHSNASVTAMIRPFPHLPIRTSFFGDELRVLRASADHQDLLGARVTHINAVEVEEIARRFRDAFGGTDANYRIMAPLLLETPAYLEAVGIPASDARIRFETDDAAPIERRLTPVDVDGIEKWTIPGDLPLSWKNDTNALITLVPLETPLYLQREERGYWREDIADLNAVYINLRTNLDDGSGQSLRDFSHETVDALLARAQEPSAIVVDLRFNHGGDLSLAQSSWLHSAISSSLTAASTFSPAATRSQPPSSAWPSPKKMRRTGR